MPIVTPGKRPCERLQKSKVFGKKGGFGKKKSGYAGLNLTAMVDMFTILVLYLLENFSTNGAILFMSKEIQLPAITSQVQLQRAPVVSISESSVIIDGAKVIDTSELLSDQGMDVPAITEKMQEKKRNIEQSSEMLHGSGFTGLVNFQVDRNLKFQILKKVMFACNTAGFNNISFAGLETSVPGAAPKTASNP